MPLREVFNAMEAQTGVHLDFSPPDDDNARICVAAYLNRADPPTLREVMAQLMWVTDCRFTFTIDESGRPSYSLLGTSVGRDVSEELRKESVAQMQAAEAESARYAEQQGARRALLRAKLGEYREALRLSRRELAARYRSRFESTPGNRADGMLLLNMLEPSRRAATEFICELPDEDLKRLFDDGKVVREWGEWSAEQRALLERGFPFDRKLLAEGPVLVEVEEFGHGIGLSVCGKARVNRLGHVDGQALAPGHHTIAVDWPNNLQDDEWVAISRALGEVRTREQEDALRRKFNEARRQHAAEYKQKWLAELALEGDLSPAGQARLSSVELAFERFESLEQWQVLELVAQASGMNVISDCFYPSEHRVGTEPVEDEEMWTGPRTCQVTALHALRVVCKPYPRDRRRHLVTDREGKLSEDYLSLGEFVGWEWGDAGSFLRFRSVGRDVWRGSLLPPEVVAALDAVIDRSLPEDTSGVKPGDMVRVSLSLRELRGYVRLISGLRPLQKYVGGRLNYEDPSDPTCHLRQQLREAMVRTLRADNSWSLYAFLASLTDSQFAEVQAEGLRWGPDLSDEQRASLSYVVHNLEHADADRSWLPQMVIRIVGPVGGDGIGEDNGRYSSIHLLCSTNGATVYEQTIGQSPAVRAKNPRHLTDELTTPPSAGRSPQ